MKRVLFLLLSAFVFACDSDPTNSDACKERCAKYEAHKEILHTLLQRHAIGYVEYSKQSQDLCDEYADCGCCD